MTSFGCKTKGGKSFSYSTLNAILRNEKYKGVYLYNRKDGKRRKHRVLLEEFGEVRNENAIKPIVSKELFDQVQTILNSRSETARPKQKSDKPFLLTGIVYCKQCGKAMSGTSQTGGRKKEKYRFYTCPNHQSKNGKTCPMKAVNADYLETAVKAFITQTVNNHLSESLLQDSVFHTLEQEHGEEMKIMQKQKDGVQSKIDRIIERITKSENPNLISQYENTVGSETEKLRQLNENLERLRQKGENLQKLKEQSYVENLTQDELFSFEEESKRFVRMFIRRIEVDETGIDFGLFQ